MERAKPASYLHTGLDRYEVFDFQEDRLGKLMTFFEKKDLPFSFHVPFFRPSYFPFIGVTTFFLNDDPNRRVLSFKLLNSTMHYGKGWKADFVVTHLTWREDSKNRRKVMKLALDTESKFCNLADKYDLPINATFYKTAVETGDEARAKNLQVRKTNREEFGLVYIKIQTFSTT